MTPNRHDVTAAGAEVDAARMQLFGTLAQVQKRLKPSYLAQDAVESAVQGVASVARKGADAIRTRPLMAAGFAGAIGLFMARGWIGKLIRGRDETPEAKKGLKNKPARPAKKGSST